eukprot:9679115-Alexandrium_andersonii.AAC.1
MMRSRGPAGPFFRASTFQYHPRYLLFTGDGVWRDLHIDNLAGAIAPRLPNDLRQGWWNIVRHRTRGRAKGRQS